MSNKLNTNDKAFIANCKKVKKGTMSLKELIDTLKFRFYIPLSIKMAVADIVNLLISNKTSPFVNEEMETFFDTKFEPPTIQEILKDYETIKFAFIISQYIGVQISVENSEDAVYDLIHEIGLYDYIIENSRGDFGKFENLVDDMTGIRYYALTSSINNLFNDIPTQEKLNEFKEMFENLDEDKLKQINSIVSFNDPMLKQVANVLSTDAIEKVMQKQEKVDNKQLSN